MIRIIFTSLLILILLSLTACTKKITQRTVKLHHSVSTFTQGTLELNNIAMELSQRLSIPLLTKDPHYAVNSALDEVTLVKNSDALHLILTGDIFQKNETKPVDSAIYIVENIGSIIKEYAHIIVQVTGHSDKIEDNHQELSDERAINIAEILYRFEARNDTFAKGCADNKPLITKNFDDESLSNARIEIYLYANKAAMRDQCR